MTFFTFIFFLFSIIVLNLIWAETKSSDVKFPTFYNVSNTTIKVNAGKPLMLYCYMRGKPTPNITWYHSESDPFQTIYPFEIPEKDKERIVYRNDSQELLFHKTVPDDNGYYTCNASNKHGSTAFIYKLTVLHH